MKRKIAAVTRRGRPPLPRWYVCLEWEGEKTQVQPLIEYLAAFKPNGSGSFLGLALNDITWDFTNASFAGVLYVRLTKIMRSVRFSRYVRVTMTDPEGKVLRRSKRGNPPDLARFLRKPRAGNAGATPKRKTKGRRAK